MKNNNKTTTAKFRCTVEEKEELKALAKNGGYSLSDFLRKQRVGIVNPIKLIKELNTIGAELNKSGTNINQIAKQINIEGKTNNITQLSIDAFLEQLEEHNIIKSHIQELYIKLLNKI